MSEHGLGSVLCSLLRAFDVPLLLKGVQYIVLCMCVCVCDCVCFIYHACSTVSFFVFSSSSIIVFLVARVVFRRDSRLSELPPLPFPPFQEWTRMSEKERPPYQTNNADDDNDDI